MFECSAFDINIAWKKIAFLHESPDPIFKVTLEKRGIFGAYLLSEI